MGDRGLKCQRHFFRNIGYADKLGSGVRNLFKYSKFYSGKEPEFIEGDVFKIIVPLDDKLTGEGTTQSATQSAIQSATRSEIPSAVGDPEKAILKLIREEPAISQKEIAVRLAMNQNTVKYHTRKMRKNGTLAREGTSRKGKWIIK